MKEINNIIKEIEANNLRRAELKADTECKKELLFTTCTKHKHYSIIKDCCLQNPIVDLQHNAEQLLDKAFNKLITKNTKINIRNGDKVRKIGIGYRGFQWSTYGWYGDKMRYLISDYFYGTETKLSAYKTILRNKDLILPLIHKVDKKELLQIANKYIFQLELPDKFKTEVTFPTTRIKIADNQEVELNKINVCGTSKGIYIDMPNMKSMNSYKPVYYRGVHVNGTMDNNKVILILGLLEIPEVKEAVLNAIEKLQEYSDKMTEVLKNMHNEMQPLMLLDNL